MALDFVRIGHGRNPHLHSGLKVNSVGGPPDLQRTSLRHFLGHHSDLLLNLDGRSPESTVDDSRARYTGPTPRLPESGSERKSSCSSSWCSSRPSPGRGWDRRCSKSTSWRWTSRCTSSRCVHADSGHSGCAHCRSPCTGRKVRRSMGRGGVLNPHALPPSTPETMSQCNHLLPISSRSHT